MTTFEVSFPDPWATLPVRAGGPERVQELSVGLAELGSTAQESISAYLTSVLPALTDLGVSGFAALTIPDPDSGELIQAFCATTAVAAVRGGHEELRDIAEGGLHPDLERDTTDVQVETGAAVRSSAFRFAEELMDDDGVAPYAFEVRYAIPLPEHRIGVLHFETMSLVYLEQLERMFDAIAGTAAVV